MTLAARLEEATKPATRRCRLGALIDSGLTEADRETLLGALADRVGYPAAAIARALRDEGHTVGLTTVKLHRAQECTCGDR